MRRCLRRLPPRARAPLPSRRGRLSSPRRDGSATGPPVRTRPGPGRRRRSERRRRRSPPLSHCSRQRSRCRCSSTRSPRTGHSTPSLTARGDPYFLDEAALEWVWSHYLPEHFDPEDLRISPLRARDFRGLPPALVLVAGHDPLARRRSPLRGAARRGRDQDGATGVPRHGTRLLRVGRPGRRRRRSARASCAVAASRLRGSPPR